MEDRTTEPVTSITVVSESHTNFIPKKAQVYDLITGQILKEF